MTVPSFEAAILQTKAYRILQQHVAACLERQGINMTQWIMLGMLLQRPDGMRLTRIANAIGVKAPLVTMIAGDLVERGLLSRVDHPTDARAKLLILTPKGRHFVDKVEAELTGLLQELLRGVTSQELETYQKVLATIIQNGDNP